MDGPQGHNQYDDTTHMPRILNQCGHTLGEMGIENFILRYSEYNKNNGPECDGAIKYDTSGLQKFPNKIPETIIQNIIASFPQNLSLLKTSSAALDDYVSSDSIHNVPYVGNNYQEKLKILSTDMKQQCKSYENYCSIHKNRLIEAFGVDDKRPLGIDCILSNSHKGHEISNLKDGYNILNTQLKQMEAILDRKQAKLNQVKADIQTEVDNLVDYDKQYESDIDVMFDKVVQIVEELRREQHQNRQQKFKDHKLKLMNILDSKLESLIRYSLDLRLILYHLYELNLIVHKLVLDVNKLNVGF